ncbi:hypothetical protein AArcCO_2591 [Halalkaliarchaeum sp. AArc-CO]|nr:hypothetical protein AArcCO_2591 [Halalkaliarchaeum sp. AArc-CO]
MVRVYKPVWTAWIVWIWDRLGDGSAPGRRGSGTARPRDDVARRRLGSGTTWLGRIRTSLAPVRSLRSLTSRSLVRIRPSQFLGRTK